LVNNVFGDDQRSEAGYDFWNTHFLRAAFVVERDEAANLLYVGLLCSIRVMFKANGITDSV
jgi:hypothetical protein